MNFQQEFKEYTQLNYVSEIKLEKPQGTLTLGQIVTLEGEQLDVECDIYEGIKVVKYDEIFENMEQILTKYSPLYVKKFQQDLFKKLEQL
ncbi:hypothetical protein pb186bvf_001259 [Paramecium bursaria]